MKKVPLDTCIKVLPDIVFNSMFIPAEMIGSFVWINSSSQNSCTITTVVNFTGIFSVQRPIFNKIIQPTLKVHAALSDLKKISSVQINTFFCQINNINNKNIKSHKYDMLFVNNNSHTTDKS